MSFNCQSLEIYSPDEIDVILTNFLFYSTLKKWNRGLFLDKHFLLKIYPLIHRFLAVFYCSLQPLHLVHHDAFSSSIFKFKFHLRSCCSAVYRKQRRSFLPDFFLLLCEVCNNLQQAKGFYCANAELQTRRRVFRAVRRFCLFLAAVRHCCSSRCCFAK